MEDKLQTISAYRLQFKYMKRNNPLKEELADKIDNGIEPNIKIDNVLEILSQIDKSFSKNYHLPYGIYTNEIGNKYLNDEFIRCLIIINAGRKGMEIDVYNTNDSNEPATKFDENYIATYKNIIYLYEFDGKIFFVFHRIGGSGCKTRLINAINHLLRPYGITCETILILPKESKLDKKKINLNSITLLYKEDKKYSDVSDELSAEDSGYVKETRLILTDQRYPKIRQIIFNTLFKSVSIEDGFAAIKSEYDDYSINDINVDIKIGRFQRKVSWTDLQELIDGYDITEEMEGYKYLSDSFIEKLCSCSDDYIKEIKNYDLD